MVIPVALVSPIADWRVDLNVTTVVFADRDYPVFKREFLILR